MKRYKVHDISEILNVDSETVRRWIRKGELIGTATSKKGGYYVDEYDLMVFVKKKPKYGLRLDRQGLQVSTTCNDLFKEKLQVTLQEMIRERDRLNVRILQLQTLLEEF